VIESSSNLCFEDLLREPLLTYLVTRSRDSVTIPLRKMVPTMD
jgi:hypothetical protein